MRKPDGSSSNKKRASSSDSHFDPDDLQPSVDLPPTSTNPEKPLIKRKRPVKSYATDEEDEEQESDGAEADGEFVRGSATPKWANVDGRRRGAARKDPLDLGRRHSAAA